MTFAKLSFILYNFRLSALYLACLCTQVVVNFMTTVPECLRAATNNVTNKPDQRPVWLWSLLEDYSTAVASVTQTHTRTITHTHHHTHTPKDADRRTHLSWLDRLMKQCRVCTLHSVKCIYCPAPPPYTQLGYNWPNMARGQHWQWRREREREKGGGGVWGVPGPASLPAPPVLSMHSARRV